MSENLPEAVEAEEIEETPIGEDAPYDPNPAFTDPDLVAPALFDVAAPVGGSSEEANVSLLAEQWRQEDAAGNVLEGSSRAEAMAEVLAEAEEVEAAAAEVEVESPAAEAAAAAAEAPAAPEEAEEAPVAEEAAPVVEEAVEAPEDPAPAEPPVEAAVEDAPEAAPEPEAPLVDPTA